MPTLAGTLMAASAAVFLVLGSMHLLYTFHGTKLHPRDADLIERMQAGSPRITRQTTMWKAWIGFNASHSGGAMLFGLMYGYLALAQPGLLFGSPFLLGVAAVFLASYAYLGKAYWFSVPYRGILLSSVLFAAALVASRF